MLKGLPDVSARDSGKQRRLVGAGSTDDQVGRQREEGLGADNGVGNVDAVEQGHRPADLPAREQGVATDDTGRTSSEERALLPAADKHEPRQIRRRKSLNSRMPECRPLPMERLAHRTGTAFGTAVAALLIAMVAPVCAQGLGETIWHGLYDDTSLTVHVLSHYLDQTNPALPNNVAWAGGGWVGYETG